MMSSYDRHQICPLAESLTKTAQIHKTGELEVC